MFPGLMLSMLIQLMDKLNALTKPLLPPATDLVVLVIFRCALLGK